MKATHALDRMRIELRQIVRVLNEEGEYEHAHKAQIALMAVNDVDPMEIEITTDDDDGRLLTPADAPLLRDAASYLRRHNAGDNAPNLARAVEHVERLMRRAQS